MANLQPNINGLELSLSFDILVMAQMDSRSLLLLIFGSINLAGLWIIGCTDDRLLLFDQWVLLFLGLIVIPTHPLLPSPIGDFFLCAAGGGVFLVPVGIRQPLLPEQTSSF